MSSSNRWYSWPTSRSPLNSDIAQTLLSACTAGQGSPGRKPSPQLAALQPPFGFANYWPLQVGCQALGYAHNAVQFKLLKLSPAESGEYPAKPGEGDPRGRRSRAWLGLGCVQESLHAGQPREAARLARCCSAPETGDPLSTYVRGMPSWSSFRRTRPPDIAGLFTTSIRTYWRWKRPTSDHLRARRRAPPGSDPCCSASRVTTEPTSSSSCGETGRATTPPSIAIPSQAPRGCRRAQQRIPAIHAPLIAIRLRVGNRRLPIQGVELEQSFGPRR